MLSIWACSTLIVWILAQQYENIKNEMMKDRRNMETLCGLFAQVKPCFVCWRSQQTLDSLRDNVLRETQITNSRILLLLSNNEKSPNIKCAWNLIISFDDQPHFKQILWVFFEFFLIYDNKSSIVAVPISGLLRFFCAYHFTVTLLKIDKWRHWEK